MLLPSSLLVLFFTLSGAMDTGIVGGKESIPHSRPYIVSVQKDQQHVCGGMVLREDFVLTAAHCLQRLEGGRRYLEVVAGAHNIQTKEQTQQRAKVKNYYQHPGYMKFTNARNWKNLSVDIMLLKLSNKLKMNKYVKAVALPKKKGKTPANVKCTIAGWGMRKPKGSASDVLYETNLNVLSTSECKGMWQHYYDPDSMMCTSMAKNNAFCQGDSGGPLMCNNKPQGMAIYTHPGECNNFEYPGVYLNISAFLKWIKDIMGKKNVEF